MTPTPVTYRAACPEGHPDARWLLAPPDTARIAPEHFTVTCAECDPPPVVVIHNPRPFVFPRARRTQP